MGTYIGAFAILAVTLAGGDAAAQAGGAADPGVQVERGKGGKTVYRITTEFVIEGRIQKPNAFYVLDRQSVNWSWADLKQDVIPRILQSVEGAPF